MPYAHRECLRTQHVHVLLIKRGIRRRVEFANLNLDGNLPKRDNAYPSRHFGVFQQSFYFFRKLLRLKNRKKKSVRIQKKFHLPNNSSISWSVNGLSQESFRTNMPRALPKTGRGSSIRTSRTNGRPAFAMVTSSPATARSMRRER